MEERLSKDYEKEKALYKGMFNKQKQTEEEEAAEDNPNQVWEALKVCANWKNEEWKWREDGLPKCGIFVSQGMEYKPQ